MKRKLLLLVLILVAFGMSLRVLAWETSWPKSPLGTDFNKDSVLVDMVKYFYEWGVFIGGILLFISLLIGGIIYLTAAGNPARMNEAKDRIFSALIGVVLLFSIYLILNTINPELIILIPPGQGMGDPCDAGAGDCPSGAACEGDPIPGDGRKGGRCVFSSTLGCDKNIDCYETKMPCTAGASKDPNKTPYCNNLHESGDCPNDLCCDPDPITNIGTCVEVKMCSKKLDKQGNGKKNGFCTSMCRQVTFYQKPDFEGGCHTVGYAGLAWAEPGCSFQDMTESIAKNQQCIKFPNNTHIESIKMEGEEAAIENTGGGGSCMVYLYEPTVPSFLAPGTWFQDVSCDIQNAALIVPGSTTNVNLDYGTDKAEFKAATIRNLGQY